MCLWMIHRIIGQFLVLIVPASPIVKDMSIANAGSTRVPTQLEIPRLLLLFLVGRVVSRANLTLSNVWLRKLFSNLPRLKSLRTDSAVENLALESTQRHLLLHLCLLVPTLFSLTGYCHVETILLTQFLMFLPQLPHGPQPTAWSGGPEGIFGSFGVGVKFNSLFSQ